jgi:hypothetical protein
MVGSHAVPAQSQEVTSMFQFISELIVECHMELPSGEIQQTAKEYLTTKRKSLI